MGSEQRLYRVMVYGSDGRCQLLAHVWADHEDVAEYAALAQIRTMRTPEEYAALEPFRVDAWPSAGEG